MARRYLLTLALCFAILPAVHAVITAPSELSAFIAEADYILVAKIDSIDGDKGQMVMSAQTDLKGKFEFRKLPTTLRPDEDGVKLKHMPLLLKRLVADVSMVIFISGEDKEFKAYGFTNGTWVQLLGKQTDKDRVVWVLPHGEPLLRKMYKGTTAELTAVIRDVLAGKAKAPKLDNSVEPGFGPEAPMKSTRRSPINDPYSGGGTLFAVIPTIGIMGPVAILAILFPTVFGGVLILFRQWTAFITMFSINSMLYLLFWWKGAAMLDGTWWGTDLGIWVVMLAVIVVCTLWAWKRQLHNLSQGADFLETPVRTEFMVLTVLAVTCAGFIGGTLYFDPPPATDVVWNLTLVLTAGIVFALVYKAIRSFTEVMLPMATEGIMLGVCSLAGLGVLAMYTMLDAGPAKAKIAGATGGDGVQFKGERWAYRSKRGGLYASSPLIAGDHVYAASAHPTFKFGVLNGFDLLTGKEQWRFNDGGAYRQPISSPALANGKLYIGEGFHEDPNCKLFCVNAADGAKVWEFQTSSQTEANPTVVNDKLYLGCGNDGFFCFTADAPKVLWKFPEKGAKSRLLRFGAGAHVEAGKVYVGTGVDRVQTDDKGETAMFCLDAESGRELWRAAMPLPVWSMPVLHQGELFVSIGNGDVFDDAPEPAGAVYRLNPANGSLVWKATLPNSVLQKPAVDEQHVYVGCRDGACYALDRKNGAIVWKVGLGAAVVGTPALARAPDGKTTAAVFAVSNRGQVACLKPQTGLALWTANASPDDQNLRFISAPALTVRPVENGQQRLLILGGGDATSGAKATLLCLEDFVPTKANPE